MCDGQGSLHYTQYYDDDDMCKDGIWRSGWGFSRKWWYYGVYFVGTALARRNARTARAWGDAALGASIIYTYTILSSSRPR
jgi:hypothetical protein